MSDDILEQLKSLEDRLKWQIEKIDNERVHAKGVPHGYPLAKAYEIKLAVWHEHLSRLDAITAAYLKNTTTAIEAREFIAKSNDELDQIRNGTTPESISNEIAIEMAKRDDELREWYRHYHPGYDPVSTGQRKKEENSTAVGQSSKSNHPPRNMTAANVSDLRNLRVFLCYSSIDKPLVSKLYERLLAAGADPWFDVAKLIPGQDWDQEISKAVRASHVLLICLSRKSITKAGYVQKEIRLALDVADEQPEGRIFLIPVRLEECDIPERLRRWQRADLFEKSGWKNLTAALELRANSFSTNLSKDM